MEERNFILNFCSVSGKIKEVKGKKYLTESIDPECCSAENHSREVFIQFDSLDDAFLLGNKNQRYLVSGILRSQMIYRKIFNHLETKLFVSSVKESIDQYNEDMIPPPVFRTRLETLLEKYSLRQKPPPNNVVIKPLEIIPLRENVITINRVTVAGKICTGLISENRDYAEFILKVKNYTGFSENEFDYFTIMLPNKIYRVVSEHISPGKIVAVEGSVLSKTEVQKKYSGQAYHLFREQIKTFSQAENIDKKIEISYPEVALKLITNSKIECHHFDLLTREKKESVQKTGRSLKHPA
ncbi:MAG TPA: hypothetical protein ENN73_05335 [Firmicutes bacterium]|nr:hypothetical protein [Bacillota bacterium]